MSEWSFERAIEDAFDERRDELIGAHKQEHFVRSRCYPNLPHVSPAGRDTDCPFCADPIYADDLVIWYPTGRAAFEVCVTHYPSVTAINEACWRWYRDRCDDGGAA